MITAVRNCAPLAGPQALQAPPGWTGRAVKCFEDAPSSDIAAECREAAYLVMLGMTGGDADVPPGPVTISWTPRRLTFEFGERVTSGLLGFGFRDSRVLLRLTREVLGDRSAYCQRASVYPGSPW